MTDTRDVADVLRDHLENYSKALDVIQTLNNVVMDLNHDIADLRDEVHSLGMKVAGIAMDAKLHSVKA